MKHKYYVEQKYFDNGRVKARVIEASEAAALGYEDGYNDERDTYDLYVYGFNSLARAQKYKQDALNA